MVIDIIVGHLRGDAQWRMEKYAGRPGAHLLLDWNWNFVPGDRGDLDERFHQTAAPSRTLGLRRSQAVGNRSGRGHQLTHKRLDLIARDSRRCN